MLTLSISYVSDNPKRKKSLKKSAAGSIKGYVKKGPHASMLRTILPPIATA